MQSVKRRALAVPSKRLRGGSGLGDSIYLRPFVDHFIKSGQSVTVMSYFPDVFIDTAATVEPFNRTRIDVTAHYTSGKHNPATNQWQDICASAHAHIPLQMSWRIQNPELIKKVKAAAGGKPIVLLIGGREPMGRRDGFGIELLPRRDCFDRVMEGLSGSHVIRLGSGAQSYALKSDQDLTDTTTVADMMDLAKTCSGVVGQCSFAVPLAEIFDKLFLGVWAAQGMRSVVPFIKSITPKKILSKNTSMFVVDDWTPERLAVKAEQFQLRINYDHEQSSRPLRPAPGG